MTTTNDDDKRRPISVSIIVTGVGQSERGRFFQALIAEHAAQVPALVIVDISYYAYNERSLGGVSEFNWLLFDAATAPFVCHIDASNESSIRLSTFMQLYELLAETAVGALTVSRDTGKADVALPEGGIPAISAVYFNENPRRRLLRTMSSTFAARLPRVALLVPMTLRGIFSGKIPILQDLAPSLANTFSHCQMSRVLYLGIDEDELVPAKVIEQIAVRFTRDLRVPLVGVVRFPPTHRAAPTMAKMYNDLFREAMMDGCDFAVQLQDDLRVETPTWDRLLGSYTCLNPRALGAYSLCDRFEPTRYNNVMVSRTHYDVFGFLFNEHVTDISRWVKGALGVHAKVVERTRCTNTIRVSRRRRQGTASQQDIEQDAAIIAADKAQFEYYLPTERASHVPI